MTFGTDSGVIAGVAFAPLRPVWVQGTALPPTLALGHGLKEEDFLGVRCNTVFVAARSKFLALILTRVFH